MVLEIILTVYCSFMQVLAGRHRCLWRQIASDTLKTPRAQRGSNTGIYRTLQGIQQAEVSEQWRGPIKCQELQQCHWSPFPRHEGIINRAIEEYVNSVV